MGAKLIINRKGVCKATNSSHNQCKDVGHSMYTYHVRVTVGDRLDKDGFIIDHQDIHEAVDRVFKGQMSSCEKLGLKVAKSVAKATKAHGCDLKEVYVKIHPQSEDPQEEIMAFMEIIHEY